MRMNVVPISTMIVILMPPVITLSGLIRALARLDSQDMELNVKV